MMLTSCCLLLGLAGMPASPPPPSADTEDTTTPEPERSGGVDVTPVALVQIQTDWSTATQGGTREHASGLDVGRAEVGIDVTVGDALDASLGYELHDESWLDARLRWRFGSDGRHRVLLGQFKQFNVMEELESTRYESFIGGTPVGGAFALSRRVGAGYVYSGERWYAAAARFHHTLDGRAETGAGHVVRAVWLPWRGQDAVLHLGASLARQGASGDQPPLRTTGLEVAWLMRSLRMQGEWLHTRETDAGTEARRGHSASLVWNLTGEHWDHADGMPEAPDPRNPAIGLWQLGLRHAGLAEQPHSPNDAEQAHWAVSLTGDWGNHWKLILQREMLRDGTAGQDELHEHRTTVLVQWHW